MDKGKNDTPVVVMSLYEAGLAIVRAFGRRGIKVIGVSPARPPGAHSRFVEYVREPSYESESERLIFFINLGQKFKCCAVIMALRDPDVMFLSRNRDVLSEYFLFFLPSHELLKILTSKLGYIEFAEKHKLTLPFSVCLNNQSDLEKITSIDFPCVLKPDSPYSWRTEKAYKIGIGGLKAIPVANEFELINQYNRVKEVGSQLILQQMIVGPDENNFCYRAFVDSDGQILAEFVGKKLRLTPPHFGMGCYVESIKSDEIINESRRILRSLDYFGIAEIDYKRDDRDGRLYFFELNPRFGFWIGLDIACGVDFPYYYYQLCIGEKYTPKVDYLLGIKWLSLFQDIKSARFLIEEGSLSWHQWILSVIKADIGAIYALDDPLPAVILFFNTIKRVLNKILLRVAKKI